MAEQLPLDFSASSAERQRRARKRIEKAEEQNRKPSLFDAPPNLDIHLDSPFEAVASATTDPERTFLWLSSVVGQLTQVNRRRVTFDPSKLDRLLWLRPPAIVTLDAAASAVARAMWAHRLGLKPLLVAKKGKRLVASSQRWPSGMGLIDVPWSAIATLIRFGVPLDIDESARALFTDKVAKSNLPIAHAGLAGSSVTIRTTSPAILEGFALPGLAYDGGKDTGSYRLSLLAAEPLLSIDQISRTPELDAAIRKATGRLKPFLTEPGFPWPLYTFQTLDVAKAMRILETTGGVLLAAEMGAGKTTMSLAMVEHLDLYPLLVVAPLSAFSTWGRQLREMGRSYYLAKDAPAVSWKRIHEGKDDVVVISFDRLPAFVELIERHGFRGVIADEIQRIRTAGSRRSRVLRQLASAVPFRIGLSGTPLTNTVADLLPIGAFLVPGEWRPRANSKDLADMYPGDPVEAVAEHLGTMMVRRRMTEVGAKLPRRNDHRIRVDLTAEQRRALADLAAEAEAAKEAGEFDGNEGRMHAFARLQKMRQIINSPSAANVPGPSPKVRACLELAQSFLAADRKGVIFCADRTTFRELGESLTEAGIKWVGLWGSTSADDRIKNEERFHTDPTVKVVLCTIQAGSESWSASPTATWLISTAYMYAPSTLSQMEARVYRMNSDPDGPEIEICYLHAYAPDGTLDDRMVEILAEKKQLFAQVIDRTVHDDATTLHYSMGDLVYLLTGTRDESLDKQTKDARAVTDREQKRKLHAKQTIYAKKGRNKTSVDSFADDGSMAALHPDSDIPPSPSRHRSPIAASLSEEPDLAQQPGNFDGSELEGACIQGTKRASTYTDDIYRESNEDDDAYSDSDQDAVDELDRHLDDEDFPTTLPLELDQ